MILTAGAVAWVALLIAAPLAPVPIAAALYGVGAVICHQLPDRSFHLFGYQLPVCARCLGIYAGAAAFLIARGCISRKAWSRQTSLATAVTARALLIAGVVPTLVTVVLEWAGVWHTSNLARACAGAPLGGAMALLLVRAMATLHYEQCTPTRPETSGPPLTPI
jgi:uncharacterized membrane protein